MAASNPLQIADSNFKSKKFTEAAIAYDSLFQSGMYSSQSLLRQAYIAEASNEPEKALFHLALFNKVHQDRTVLTKMEELAIANNIKGYEISDHDLFMTYYAKYHPIVAIGILSLGVLLFVIFAFKVIIQHELNLGLGILAFVLSVGVVATTIYSPESNDAVATQSTVILNSPSAGGEPVEILQNGDRCQIESSTSSGWLQAEVGDQEGYAFKAHLRPIQFP